VEASKLAELPAWAGALLEELPVGRLGYRDEDGAPRVLPVTFAVAEGRVWSAIDDKPKRDPGREPARVRCLRRDPRASFTADRYSDEWSELAWVQLLGEVEVVAAGGAGAALDALRRRYRQYDEKPLRGPLLALEVRRCLCWRAST